MKLNKRKLKLMIEQSLHEGRAELDAEMNHPLLLKVKSALESVGLPVEINTGVQNVKLSVLIRVEYDTVYIFSSYKHAPQVGLALIPLTLAGHKFIASPKLQFGEILFSVT